MEREMVKLNASDAETNGREGEIPPQAASQGGLISISRRRFLKVLGAGSAVGAAGCASDATQKILPYVKPDAEQIPGVAVWYSSSCTECSAGCGIRVRTREGKAVKVEGNPDSPVNRGSLCALGQSALQGLYDPDRIRHPLKRKLGPTTARLTKEVVPEYEEVSWETVFATIGSSVLAAKGKKLFLTGEGNASQVDLLKEWVAQLGFENVVYDAMQPVAVAKASELAYGVYGVPAYSIDKADVVLNIGSDFLETFVAPVTYARQWADSRKSSKPLRLVHVEPRLSLTGANADMWLKANPGSELQLVLFVIKGLLERGRAEGLSADVRGKLSALTSGLTLVEVEEQTGVTTKKLSLVTQYLSDAKSSLVLAGGAATATADPLPLLVAVNLLNLMLGNVGKTVDIAQMRVPHSSATKLASAIEEMQAEKVDVLFTYGTNPAFTFPTSFGFKEAVGKVGVTSPQKKTGLVVAFASHLDETAELADYVLPVHTPLEDWGYIRPVGAPIGLLQPTMRPIFNTKSFGDALIAIATAAKKTIPGVDAKGFEGFVRDNFLKLTASAPGANTEKFWLESVERGGYFTGPAAQGTPKVTVSAAALDLSFGITPMRAKADELILYPFPSVKTFDGRAANRPWMQELSDPITQAVWGAWAEIHPTTAKKFGIEHKDLAILRTEDGETHVPVFVTDYVHEGIVAVPQGQGHSSYGRYAKSVGRGSLYSLLPKKLADKTDVIPLLGTAVKVIRGLGEGSLVTVQDFNSQMGRELARTTLLSGAAAHAHGHGEGEHGSGHEHHAPKQMYEQREHPLYQWGLNIDLAACTGCSACVVACSAENNIPVVGKAVVEQGREMAWIRIERYYDSVPTEGGGEELKVSFLPMMCQHCQNAPCEPVCPVYATYHNEEGMNAMVYNRCVGTRYCSNNCSYKVRRFNWFQYEWPELLDWQVNPDVPKRSVGIMEKCSFCVQRIAEAKDIAKDLGRMVEDGEIKPACVQTCPTQALTFGNLKDPNSRVSKLAKEERAYKVLDHHLNTQPSVVYMNDIRYKA
jgi:anaerobic selenocysteine-containing dehydrogenase/Fe-S-cluster-containing dehydrogenase component